MEELMRLVWMLTGMEGNLQVFFLCAVSRFGIGLSGLAAVTSARCSFALCFALEAAYLNLRIEWGGHCTLGE